MSFQAYIDTVRAKTGKGPDDWRKWAASKDFLGANGLARPDVKAGVIVDALKSEFGLGHGHAMSIVTLLKGSKHADGVK